MAFREASFLGDSKNDIRICEYCGSAANLNAHCNKCNAPDLKMQERISRIELSKWIACY